MPTMTETPDFAQSVEPLFEGDTGTLRVDERQLLVTLLRGPYLLRSEKPNLWNTLVNSRDRIVSRLNDLFLGLVMDSDLGIAFCRQADLGEMQAVPLLRRVTLRFLDSVLLLEMRDRLLDAEATAERALISADNIEEILRGFDPAARTNEKLFKNHVNAVIARLLRRKLLIRVNDSVRLFEISMVLRLIFNAEEVASLKAAFKAKRLGETDPDEMPQDDDETEDETA